MAPGLKSGCARPVAVVADDHPQCRKFLAQLLRDAGYEVLCASDGTTLVQLVREQQLHGPVSVIITDNAMPNGDGLSALSTLRAICPDTVTVLVTGGLTAEVEAAAGELGAHALSKPVSAHALLALLAQIV